MHSFETHEELVPFSELVAFRHHPGTDLPLDAFRLYDDASLLPTDLEVRKNRNASAASSLRNSARTLRSS